MYFSNTDWTITRIRQEIENGYELLNNINTESVFFAGSRGTFACEKHYKHYYKHCEKLAYELGKMGYAIISGGGPGIMKAANEGATRAKAISIGLRAELLPAEHIKDDIYTHELSFHFFFIRRFIMQLKSVASIFYPGGFGTLTEFFENAFLMQDDIIDKFPLILVGEEYWKELKEWLSKELLKNKLIDKDFFSKYIYFTDDITEIKKIIKKGP